MHVVHVGLVAEKGLVEVDACRDGAVEMVKRH